MLLLIREVFGLFLQWEKNGNDVRIVRLLPLLSSCATQYSSILVNLTPPLPGRHMFMVPLWKQYSASCTYELDIMFHMFVFQEINRFNKIYSNDQSYTIPIKIHKKWNTIRSTVHSFPSAAPTPNENKLRKKD